MKKGLKITVIVVAAIVAIIIIVPLTLRGKIDQIVKREASAMLTANLTFDKLGISLIRHFPNASLDLKNLALVGTQKFEGDTLVHAKQISVVVNLMSLFSDSGFQVRELILDKPSILAIQLKTGEVNWDIMKPTQADQPTETESSGSSFRLSMKDLRINDGRITYIDSLSQMSFYTDNLDMKMEGDMSAVESKLKLELDTENIYYVMGKMAMLKNANAELDMDINANFATDKYTFNDNKIKLNEIEVAVDGWVQRADSALNMDVKLISSEVEFKELLSMIPAFYTKDFKELSAKGALSISAWAKGRLSKDDFPACEATLKVENGSFKYASLPKSVDNINIKASVVNAGGTADNSIISVENFSASIAGNTLVSNMYATTPVSDMNFRAAAKGAINLGMIKEVYPLGDSITLSGIITADLGVSGKMSDIEKQKYESIKANGTFTVKNMVASLATLPRINISEAAASISPQALTLSSLQTKIGDSDISATGHLTNYLGYILRNDKLSGKLNVSSKLLDVNQLMGSSEQSATTATVDTSKMTVFVVPENLNLSINANAAKILFQKMVINNFAGSLSVANGTLSMDKLSMNAMGGKIAANGSYSTAENPSSPKLALNLNISNCSFSQTFKELEMVQKIVPLFEKTGGNYSMSFDMNTLLNSEMSPELKTLTGKGVIESSNIKIQNIKAFDALSVALKNDKIKNIETKDIKIPFTISNGQISTSPFTLQLGDVKLNLSGVTGLDQSIDYTAKVTMPKAVGGILSNVNVKIGGTFSSPKITLGVKDMADELLRSALDQGIEKLTGGKNIDKVVTANVEKIRSEAQAAAGKLMEFAKIEGDKLVDKASNPLAKIAAKKSAELMLKKAQEQGQKLIDAAEQKVRSMQGN